MKLNNYTFILFQRIFVSSETLKPKLSTCTKNLGCSILIWEHAVLVCDLDGSIFVLFLGSFLKSFVVMC